MPMFFKKQIQKLTGKEKEKDKVSVAPGSLSSKKSGSYKRKKSDDAVEEGGTSDAAVEHPVSAVVTKADLFKPIAKLDVTDTTAKHLFLHKIRLCQLMFDWTNDGGSNTVQDAQAKEAKRQCLLDLIEYIGKAKAVFTEEILIEIINMLSINLFRALPPHATSVGGGEGEEEEPVSEPSWPHLQIVYEFFLRFIVSADVDIKTLKKFITPPFVLKILQLFESEDNRERDYLKTILHRIYAKFMSLRALIRSSLNNVFYVFIYDTERHCGIAELLEILGSIINGFAVPLKDEHKTFMTRVLVPLHKVKPLASFHHQLSYCVTQLVDKDPQLAIPTISGLIKYWPVTNSAKEVLFLNEIEELLELTQPTEFTELGTVLFTQLARCIGSHHFQVAERALFLWHNEYIFNLIAENRQVILPILYPVLHVNSQTHWNTTVNNLTLNVLNLFTDLDRALVEECSKQFANNQLKAAAVKKQKNDIWEELERKRSEAQQTTNL